LTLSKDILLSELGSVPLISLRVKGEDAVSVEINR
jgi:hypothetical protein